MYKQNSCQSIKIPLFDAGMGIGLRIASNYLKRDSFGQPHQSKMLLGACLEIVHISFDTERQGP